MSSLQEALRRFLAVEGVRTAALIDIATGMIVRSVGKAAPGLAETATCVVDEVRAARAALGLGGQAGDLSEITTVTTNRLQVAKILQDQPGEGLLLFVDADRSRVNLGLITPQVDQLAPEVLA